MAIYGFAGREHKKKLEKITKCNNDEYYNIRLCVEERSVCLEIRKFKHE